MYLWRRSASPRWLNANEDELRALAGDRLAIIERPNRRRLQLEAASQSRGLLQKVARQFGGRIEKLPRHWLKRSLRRKAKPLKVGNKKLIIPAGRAFGTGEHATTTMSLRLLEQVSRSWKRDWSIVDLVDISAQDRHHHRESVQRIANRAVAETQNGALADLVRNFARTRA